MTRTMLITGGAGFIGAAFARHVCTHLPRNIIVLDSLTYAGHTDRLRDCKIRFVHGDIRDSDLLRSLFANTDIHEIVHFAAETHVDRAIRDPAPFISSNIAGSYSLFEIARSTWPATDDRVFVHISTDEVYGSLSSNAPPFTEESPISPRNPYSASKAAGELLARAWWETFQFPCVVLRPSNTYGPWQYPEKLIPVAVCSALKGCAIPVYGDGRQVRDWLDVADLCDAIVTVLAHRPIGLCFNVAGRCERANLDVVTMVCDAVDALQGNPGGRSRELIRHVGDRVAHDRRYAMDGSRIAAVTGWRPRHVLDARIRGLVEWYSTHTDWWSNLFAAGDAVEGT